MDMTQERKPAILTTWTEPTPCFAQAARAAKWFNGSNYFNLYIVERAPQQRDTWVVCRRTRVPLFAQEGLE